MKLNIKSQIKEVSEILNNEGFIVENKIHDSETFSISVGHHAFAEAGISLNGHLSDGKLAVIIGDQYRTGQEAVEKVLAFRDACLQSKIDRDAACQSQNIESEF